jgi:hypothetical protein
MKRSIERVAVVLTAITLLYSCQKEMDPPEWQQEIAPNTNKNTPHGHLKQTKNFSSEVAIKWMNMQLRLVRINPTPLGGTPAQRYFVYGAVAMYESVVPGMPAYKTLAGQLAKLPPMPKTVPGKAYYWPACVNATMAAMTRSFFTAATAAGKASVDSLELALNVEYSTLTDPEILQRSIDFGKAVAQKVFAWSATDRSAGANAPYVPPIGPGLWVPTPPAFAPAAIPYWGNNRLWVSSSLNGTAPPPPPVYSEDPSSAFYKMAQEIYDVSQTLTPAQLNLAIYYRGAPGYGGAHYLSILTQILENENPTLDFTALVFAKTCIALVDANIGCFKVKYHFNQMRPITYIRSVLGHSDWNSAIVTPPFPDFTSAHSASAGAFVEILEGFFGTDYPFTDHAYDYLGLAPLSYASLDAMANAIGASRVYGGIHYRLSCEAGEEQGRKIAQNVENSVRFKK